MSNRFYPIASELQMKPINAEECSLQNSEGSKRPASPLSSPLRCKRGSGYRGMLRREPPPTQLSPKRDHPHPSRFLLKLIKSTTTPSSPLHPFEPSFPILRASKPSSEEMNIVLPLQSNHRTKRFPPGPSIQKQPPTGSGSLSPRAP